MDDRDDSLRQLIPGAEPVSAGALIASLALGDPALRAPGLPRCVAVMVCSIDGRVAIAGRSGGLGHPADRALLRGMRAAADAVLVGTGTIAAEGYGRLLDDDDRERRVAAGRLGRPPVVTISRTGRLPWQADLFSEPGWPVLAFVGEAQAADTVVAADLTLVERPPDALAPAAVLAELAERGIGSVTCEGGPGLLAALLAAGCVDDVLLTIAPLLAGGDAPGLLAPTGPIGARLALAGIWRADDHLVLHYRRQR